MKKIVSLLLVLVLAVAVLASCQSVDVSAFDECYARSYPHVITVETEQVFGNKSLVSEKTLQRGYVGEDFFAKETYVGQEFRSIEDGSGVNVYEPIADINTVRWYRENMGVSEDKGKTWDSAAASFFPAKGGFALNLDTSVMEDVVIDGNTLTFTVAASNTKTVFGEDTTIASDVDITVKTDGAVVTNCIVEYVVPAADSGVDEVSVKVSATYIYSQQEISLD